MANYVIVLVQWRDGPGIWNLRYARLILRKPWDLTMKHAHIVCCIATFGPGHLQWPPEQDKMVGGRMPFFAADGVVELTAF